MGRVVRGTCGLGRPSAISLVIEDARLDLMGIGVTDPTAEQRRLRTLVMCAPLRRRFDETRPDARELYAMQEQLIDMRSEFVTTGDAKRLARLADRIVQLDAHLSARQSVADLRDYTDTHGKRRRVAKRRAGSEG